MNQSGRLGLSYLRDGYVLVLGACSAERRCSSDSWLGEPFHRHAKLSPSILELYAGDMQICRATDLVTGAVFLRNSTEKIDKWKKASIFLCRWVQKAGKCALGDNILAGLQILVKTSNINN